MKLKLVNEATAIDEEGRVWFKTNIFKAHAYWSTCDECKKRTNVFWKCYPDIGKIVCDTCREELE